ncbi:MAG: hypothetical protein ACUVXB_17430, partial [Bryobacteraceae bacterium]
MPRRATQRETTEGNAGYPNRRSWFGKSLPVPLLAWLAQPQPRAVDPGGPGKAPSDAVVLFDGRDVAQWTRDDGSPTGCRVVQGEM